MIEQAVAIAVEACTEADIAHVRSMVAVAVREDAVGDLFEVVLAILIAIEAALVKRDIDATAVGPR